MAYIDCTFGVAGDMLLAACIDAGCEIGELVSSLKKLGDIEDDWSLKCTSVFRGHGRITGKHVNVVSNVGAGLLPPPKSQETVHDHAHVHDHACSHSHSHEHSHDRQLKSLSSERNGDEQLSSIPQQNHDKHERNLNCISNMINSSDLPLTVKNTAIHAFTELAAAEARVHGCSLTDVHFHEVGAIDSIIDTVGVILALYILGVDMVYASALPIGSGTVWTEHGLMPAPAPATLLLMQDMKLAPGPPVTGELATPTGVSLVRALCGMPSLVSRCPFSSEQTVSHRQGM